MNNFIKENWFKISLLIILIIGAVGWFYWFQWRPIKINRECYYSAHGTYISATQEVLSGKTVPEIQDEQYKECLQLRGFKK